MRLKQTKKPNPKCPGCGEYLKSKCDEPNMSYKDACNLLANVVDGTAKWKWICLKCGASYEEEK